MKKFAHDQYPVTDNPKRGVMAHFAAKQALSAEATAPRPALNWGAAAHAARPVATHEKGTLGSELWFNGSIAEATLANGSRRSLKGVMFVGDTRFGFVTETAANETKPSKFMLTVIGDGQKSGLAIREISFQQLKEVRPEGYVQSWQDFKIGRAPDNDVVMSGDNTVSAHHATLRVSADRVEMFDEHSTNGTTYLHEGQGYNTINPDLGAVWTELYENPALWSGEFRGETVIKAQ